MNMLAPQKFSKTAVVCMFSLAPTQDIAYLLKTLNFHSTSKSLEVAEIQVMPQPQKKQVLHQPTKHQSFENVSYKHNIAMISHSFCHLLVPITEDTLNSK